MSNFFSYILGFLTLIFLKSVSEPIATQLGSMAIKKFDAIVPKVMDELDLKWLPQGYVSTGKATYDWLINTAIPEKAAEEAVTLNEQDIVSIASYVVKTFDLETHLNKLAKSV